MSAPRSAAMSALSQIGSGEDQQSVGRVHISRFLTTLSCIVGSLGGGTDGHECS